MAEGQNEIISKVPSNPNYPGILFWTFLSGFSKHQREGRNFTPSLDLTEVTGGCAGTDRPSAQGGLEPEILSALSLLCHCPFRDGAPGSLHGGPALRHGGLLLCAPSTVGQSCPLCCSSGVRAAAEMQVGEARTDQGPHLPGPLFLFLSFSIPCSPQTSALQLQPEQWDVQPLSCCRAPAPEYSGAAGRSVL